MLFKAAVLLLSSAASASFLDTWGTGSWGSLLSTAPIPSLPSWLSGLLGNVQDHMPKLTIQVLVMDNQSASLNCSHFGGEFVSPANLTWSVDGVESVNGSLARGEGLVLVLAWGERNLTQGDTVMVTCSALAGEDGWAEMSSVSQLLTVPGSPTNAVAAASGATDASTAAPGAGGMSGAPADAVPSASPAAGGTSGAAAGGTGDGASAGGTSGAAGASVGTGGAPGLDGEEEGGQATEEETTGRLMP